MELNLFEDKISRQFRFDIIMQTKRRKRDQSCAFIANVEITPPAQNQEENLFIPSKRLVLIDENKII